MKMMRWLGVAGGATLFLAMGLYAQAQPPEGEGGNGAPSSASAQNEGARYKAAQAANCALAKTVRSAIVRAGVVDPVLLYVTASDGAVVLMGSVHEMSHAERAVQIAKQIPGVKSVRDVLTLRLDS
jgi:hyperosmotically inducible protein